MIVGVSDKVLIPWLEGKEYVSVSNEAEAIAIAAGHWIATKQRATVFMSADGFCNALNPITSWIMPEGIEMDIYISTGRTEPSHIVMTKILPELLELLDYDTSKLFIELVWKQ